MAHVGGVNYGEDWYAAMVQPPSRESEQPGIGYCSHQFELSQIIAS